MSENNQVPFPELDEAVEKYVSDLAAKNIEIIMLKNEVTALSNDLYIKNVLLTEGSELISYSQICSVSMKHYTPLATNRMSERSIRMFVDFLDKKNTPS
ncbi:hypothetical protein BRE01_49230 [Brevibacillus reuszeri]|uniref:Uncharacterized protein n=1 Tax=Brevibacillus reuszeri TaxID=54915 RepID=A0A0K9YLI7_9BACL|nr:hypothetical protein [Brevibacillus reuszeri]KNB69522.1 hypothetical protein ADS79_27030 [Brevibacillus reuszeri]MED1856114.1 hypothetical protein [Brevibacillus reuszeri]GED71221.1 hypothetical protein BRE01_49230 [Brevibacillus reuszeri]